MPLTAPSVPASGTALANPTGQYASVVPAGGTATGEFVSYPGNAPTITTPAVAASTVAVTNTTGFPAAVAVSGGTVTVIAVNGVTIYTATGNTVVVPAGGTITLTYSAAPTWTWTPVIAGLSQAAGALTAPMPVPPGASITLIYSVAPTWTWTNPIDLAETPGYYAENTGASVAPWSPYTTLPYPQHATLGVTGLGTGVSN